MPNNRLVSNPQTSRLASKPLKAPTPEVSCQELDPNLIREMQKYKIYLLIAGERVSLESSQISYHLLTLSFIAALSTQEIGVLGRKYKTRRQSKVLKELSKRSQTTMTTHQFTLE